LGLDPDADVARDGFGCGHRLSMVNEAAMPAQGAVSQARRPNAATSALAVTCPARAPAV